MSLRTLILLSPFVLAVLLGKAASVPEPDTPSRQDPMTDFSMSKYQWESRPILVFAPSKRDPAARSAVEAWHMHKAEILDRDLVLVEAYEEGPSRAEGRVIPENSAVQLRRTYRAEPGAVTVVLVGKDGSEKGRWDRLPPLSELFGQIDAMPVRQREIGSRGPAPSE